MPKLKERESKWKESFSDLEKLKKKGKRIWFHAASMGEFEQAKPIIEKIKKTDKNVQIIASFYSPSGYNTQKNYGFVDAAVYMPFDSRKNAKEFIEKIKPDIAIFIRYEIWRNHLEILKKNGIPRFLICATKPGKKITYSGELLRIITRSSYELFTKIFAVSKKHADFFESMDVRTDIVLSKDTRFDRIVEKVEESKINKILPEDSFADDDFVLVAGSVWESDETKIIKTVKRIEKEKEFYVRVIFVPHEPTPKHIKNLKEYLPNAFLLSQILEFTTNDDKDKNLKEFLGRNQIIVDSVGKLLKLYSIADAAYIGGGFGAGVHSVAEPAGYGIPLASGPKINNSPDALNLENLDALSITRTEKDIYEWIVNLIKSKKAKEEIGKTARLYVFNSAGESDRIVAEIFEHLK